MESVGITECMFREQEEEALLLVKVCTTKGKFCVDPVFNVVQILHRKCQLCIHSTKISIKMNSGLDVCVMHKTFVEFQNRTFIEMYICC